MYENAIIIELQEKYAQVLKLGKELNVRDGDGSVEEMDGTLKISRTVPLQGQKDLLWNKIKTIGGGNPAEIEADINVDLTGARFHDLTA